MTTINVRGEKINVLYNEGTNGHSLVLLHPALAQAVFYMPLVAELNASGFTTVTVDFPNHGTSEGIARTSIEEYADFTEDLVNALRNENLVGEEVSLVGWSMGGTTAYEVSVRNPLWLKSIVMLSSSNYWGFDELPFTEEEYDAGHCAREAENAEQKYIRDFLNTAKAMLPSFDSCAGDWKACAEYDGRGKEGKIEVPLFHAWGGVDELGAQAANKLIEEKVTHALSYYDPEANHNLPAEKPAEIAASITEFILHNTN